VCVTALLAISQGVETRDPSHFITDENIERLRLAKQANRVQVYTVTAFLSNTAQLVTATRLDIISSVRMFRLK
jgi:hypothetical protein